MTKKQLTPEEMMERNLRRQMQRHGAKIRERINADRELAEAQRKDEAKRLIDAMLATKKNRQPGDSEKVINLAGAIRNVVTIVARSFDLDQKVVFDFQKNKNVDDRMLSAWTDLKTVTVRLNTEAMCDLSDDGIRRTVAIIKGGAYHEFAHCLFTKHLILDYFPNRNDAGQYQHSWNLLEDGRIEDLLILKSPVLKRYLLPLLWHIVMNFNHNWSGASREIITANNLPYLIVRSYAPRGMRRAMITGSIKASHHVGVSPHRVQQAIKDMIRLIDEYKRCTTIVDQVVVIKEFDAIHTQWQKWFGATNPNDTVHIPNDWVPSEDGDIVPSPIESDWTEDEVDQVADDAHKIPSINEDEGEGEGDEDGNSDEDGDSDGEGEGEGESTPSDTPSDTTKPSDNTADGHGESTESDNSESTESDNSESTKGGRSADGDESDAQIDDDDHKDEFNKSVDDSVSEYELNSVLSEFNRTNAGGLPRWVDSSKNGNPLKFVVDNGEMVRTGMLNALDTVVMTASPSWKYRMDNGAVLDVDAFTNRELGDDAYWMAKDDSGERGHDLAISVLLDCSGSMSSELAQLSACAYGIHSASKTLGIPCTTSIFGSSQYLLWDNEDDPTHVLLPDLGGTSIGGCLDDLPNQRSDKSRHIVFILTDGAWEYSIPSLQPYANEGMFIVLIGLGIRMNELTRRSPHRAVTIRNVIDLPKQVELVIGDFFR